MMLRRLIDHSTRNPTNLLANVLLIFVTLSLSPQGLSNETPDPSSIRPEAQEAFAWFKTLDFPDISDKKFVRVATGEWVRHGNDPPQNTFVHAFLLSEEPDSFTVLTIELFLRTFKRTPPSTPEHERVYYESTDLPERADFYLEFLRSPDADNFRGQNRMGKLQLRAMVFFYSYACWKNGLESRALSLFEQAKTLGDQDPDTGARSNMVDALQRDIGHAMMWRAVLAAGDPSVSRPELLKLFENIVENYPKSEHIGRAQELAEILKEMIEEDQVPHPEKLDELPIEKQASELIYRLRDQHGYQISQPGYPNFFNDSRGEDSPAHRLVAIGYPAVPQLIDHLLDERLTRTIEFYRNFVFRHKILRVGDAAKDILEKIAHRRFCELSIGECYLKAGDEMLRTKEKVEAWWQELQLKGELKLLADAVSTGDSNSAWQATTLVSKYPDDAMEPIIRGVKNAESAYIRADLTQVASDLPENISVPFLLKEMNNAPILDNRIIAASGLLKHGRPEAVPAMIEEWKRLSKTGSDNRWDANDLIEFLAGCNKPEAIEVMAEGLSKQPIDLRLEVNNTFGSIPNYLSPRIFSRFDDSRKVNQNVEAAIEKLLIEELNDTETLTIVPGTYSTFKNTRMYDIAGRILSERWPDKYSYDPSAPLNIRDRQRIECANIWRIAHNKEILPLPSPRPVVPQPNMVSKAMFTNSSGRPDQVLAEAVESIRGKTMTPESFSSLLHLLKASSEKRVSGYWIEAVRDGDGTGIRIMIDLTSRKPFPENARKYWNETREVNLAQERVYDDSRSRFDEAPPLFSNSQEHEYNVLNLSIRKALESDPGIPFIISVYLQLEARTPDLP